MFTLAPSLWFLKPTEYPQKQRTCQAGIVERDRIPAITPVDIYLLILNKVLYPVQVSHARRMVDICFGTCLAYLQPSVWHVRCGSLIIPSSSCLDNMAHVVYGAPSAALIVPVVRARTK